MSSPGSGLAKIVTRPGFEAKSGLSPNESKTEPRSEPTSVFSGPNLYFITSWL